MKQPVTPEAFVKIARAVPRDERTPYAFEKRVMARLATAPEIDAMALWARGLWQAAAPCLAVMVIAAVVSISYSKETPATDIDLETAVVAPAQAFMDSGV